MAGDGMGVVAQSGIWNVPTWGRSEYPRGHPRGRWALFLVLTICKNNAFEFRFTEIILVIQISTTQ